METYGYLERGTLIQVGTILKIGNELREVIAFIPRQPHQSYGKTVYNFLIETAVPGAGWEDNAEYDRQDLEDMLKDKTLKIYNEG